MFAMIGMFVVWAVAGYAFMAAPTVIGGVVSDRRKDDGSAFYFGVALSGVAAAIYVVASVGVLVWMAA